ncbi:MAG: hypothetical protein HON70_38270 [Lentisphaerae bacterium]|nr:hypothetical protein [Lentisphaerota bacterium]
MQKEAIEMMTTITRAVSVAGLVLGMALTSNVQAGEKVSVEAGADTMSRYVWRGQRYLGQHGTDMVGSRRVLRRSRSCFLLLTRPDDEVGQ